MDVLRMHNCLKINGNEGWGVPYKNQLDIWTFDSNILGRILVSDAPYETPGNGETDWVHASIFRKNELPTYEDLVLMHKAIFKDGWAYQVFAPKDSHINIHNYALHLWGRADGKPQLPDFPKLSGLNSI